MTARTELEIARINGRLEMLGLVLSVTQAAIERITACAPEDGEGKAVAIVDSLGQVLELCKREGLRNSAELRRLMAEVDPPTTPGPPRLKVVE